MVSCSVVKSRDVLARAIAFLAHERIVDAHTSKIIRTPALFLGAVEGDHRDAKGFLVCETGRTMGVWAPRQGKTIARCSLSLSVHPFRAFLAFCCACDHLMLSNAPEFPDVCPMCSKDSSTMNCRFLHTWGTCASCVPFDVDEDHANDREEVAA